MGSKSRRKNKQKTRESTSKVELNLDESESLLKRIESNQLTAGDLQLFGTLVRWYLWLIGRVSGAGRSLNWLKKALGLLPNLDKAEPKDSSDSQSDSTASESNPKALSDSHPLDDSKSEEEPQESSKPSELKKQKKSAPSNGHNHGKLKADAYTGAQIEACSHHLLQVGGICPLCGGSLHAKPPALEIRISGSPIASATRYELERLRCSGCGWVYTANLPEEASLQKYDERIRAILALMTHSQGFPAKRIESFQAALGVPLPDATQWNLTEEISQEVAPVLGVLFLQAAQTHLIYQDDTSVRILELMEENQQLDPKKDRVGMHTTALVAEGGTPACPHRIVLYFPGRKHAGERLADLLEMRSQELPDLLQMSDALSANQKGNFSSISLLCNAHAVRNFKELLPNYPDEASWILDLMKEVYKNDGFCQKSKMTDIQRLVYHQTLSFPIMEALRERMLEHLEDPQTQPNEPLAVACRYMLKRWEAFTGFCHHLGAPIDNSLCERMLKLAIRHRNNSLFYKTTRSAEIGARLTSVIQTCIEAGKNPFDYLVALQKNFTKVAQAPQNWLPWNYQETLSLNGAFSNL